MVRKSERNKSTSDKVATPSRKATRSSRRRKKSTSESDAEPDAPEQTVAEEIPLPSQQEQPAVEVGETSEAKEVRRGRGRPRRQLAEEPEAAPAPESTPTPTSEPIPEEPAKNEKEWNEDETFWESSKAGPSDPLMDNENSTWKIQSSNGAGGEIQKLKICRQRLTDSAESSSSPAKEVASPRRKRYRKRKGKDRHLEDGTESTGSHTDTEAPSSTVVDADRSPTLPPEVPEDNAVADSTSQQEIPLPAEKIVTREADSATSEPTEAPVEQADAEIAAAVKGIIVELESEPEGEPEREPDEPEEQPEQEPEEEPEEQPEPDPNDEPKQKPKDEPSLEPDGPNPGTEEAQKEVDDPEEIVVESAEAEVVDGGEETVVEQDMIVVESESVILEEEAVAEVAESAPSPTPDSSAPPESEDVEEGELEPKKPKRNLKLAVTNEDAMQQIAMKLNERAARFSKEATEEAARKSAPVRPAQPVVEEEEEEGEISRDPGSTKTLELKRLSDDDIEPNNLRKERHRRPVSHGTPTTPVDSEPSKHDISTEALKIFISDVVEPVNEEEVQFIFNPKEDDLDVRGVHSDNDSSVEVGEIGEEEGELIEEPDERRKSLDDRHSKSYSRTTSREEIKRTERRVTKESKESSKKSGKNDRKDRRLSADEPKAKKKYERSDKERDDRKHKSGDKMEKPEVPKSEENHKTVRKISIVPDDSKNLPRSVSPSSKKPSPVLFVTNLTRPFTIGQLRELLLRTGSIAPNGFYIDKIKSKCFVKYNDVEMAIETRHALHGVRWPITNPRTLRVDFSTDEAMETVKKMAEEEDNAAKKQDLAAQHFDRGWLSEKDVMKPSKKPKNLVREWDMGKDVSATPVNDSNKKGQEEDWGKPKDKRGNKEEGGRRRHASPITENTEPARKVKRRDTDAPAKLLDDLFRKTVATPCIYWLPLTASQIAVKEEMRRQHMAEHQKRLAELKKSDSSRRDKDKSRERERERDRARDRRRK